MPPNLQTVSLKFARRRSAKVMGSLAARDSEPVEGEEVQGILVTHNFTSKIVRPDDLATYTPLRTGSILSKLHVPFSGSIETFRLFLSEMFTGVLETLTEEDDTSSTRFSLPGDLVSVTLGISKGVAIVEWEASQAGDVIADAVIALLMHAQSSTASIRMTSKPCCHPRPSKRSRADDAAESRLLLVKDTLSDQFQLVEAVYEGNTGTFEITTDSGLESNAVSEGGILTCTATVAFSDESGADAKITVECLDKKLALQVQECLKGIAATFAPVSP